MKFDEIGVMPKILIRITHDKEKYDKWCRKQGVIVGHDSHAEATTFENGDEFCAMVRMTDDTDISAVEDAALLAHEAVHVAHDYMAFLGESAPSEEFTAYVVQHIAAYLIDKHYAWKRKRLKKQPT